MPALRRHFGNASPLAVLRDLKENNGAGIEQSLRAVEETDDEGSSNDDGQQSLLEDKELVEADVVVNEFDEALEFTTSGLPSLATAEGLRLVDEMAGLSHGVDDEVAQFLVNNRVAGLWERYTHGEQEAVEEALKGQGGFYYELIRSRFREELAGVENVKVPKGWSFEVDGMPTLPNTMQKRTAYEVLAKKRVGNWSGVGSGKTLSAILASRVVDARRTLVIAANSTIDGWCKEIRSAFPDSVIHRSVPVQISGSHNYVVLNYEKFQQQNRGELVRNLIDLGFDFVVLDEVQKAKQRDKNASRRREAIQGMLSHMSEARADLRVLAMSATPVLNNLYEGVTLVELVTGRSHAEMGTRATVNNALALHRALMVNGFRYQPRHEIEMDHEVVEINGNDLLGELVRAHGVLGLEQALLPLKLEAMEPYVREGTLIYTHYVNGMVGPIRRHVEEMGYTVGLYTGDDKSGFVPFLEGDVDVLVGSLPVGTGLDGLQAVCDNLVILSPPWTAADDEQLKGRLRRQGSNFERVSVVVPQVVLDQDGDQWSWDRGRTNTIRFKRTLSDCAVDGRIPQTVRISKNELLKQSKVALEEWIARIGKHGLVSMEREHLRIPLPPEIRKKVEARRGDFSTINQRWSTSNSDTVYNRLQEEPEEWYLYHTLYREAREGWDEIPAERIARQLENRPDWKVGDFGCGECLLKVSLPGHEVISLDYVALDEDVIACDMAHTPLEDHSLDVVVFSLSLMGHNWQEYLTEAHRVLRPFGLLFVAETARKWEKGDLEQALTKGFGISTTEQRGDFHYLVAMKKG